jgi:hypothetical protein
LMIFYLNFFSNDTWVFGGYLLGMKEI